LVRRCPQGDEPDLCLQRLLSNSNHKLPPGLKTLAKRLTARVDSAATTRAVADPSTRDTQQVARYARLVRSQ
jgi:hypothetical protein